MYCIYLNLNYNGIQFAMLWISLEPFILDVSIVYLDKQGPLNNFYIGGLATDSASGIIKKRGAQYLLRKIFWGGGVPRSLTKYYISLYFKYGIQLNVVLPLMTVFTRYINCIPTSKHSFSAILIFDKQTNAAHAH